ncbi:MAG: 50S ribosomal protein L35 [Candidatus Rokubacteria bacterium]|nr:50S ribosomal protein L35 [Candidatus Rokubacteria bacterium]
MPKLKTKRGAAKRFKATATGKIKRAKGWASHLLEWKQPKRKRQLRKATLVSAADARRIRRLLPYL